MAVCFSQMNQRLLLTEHHSTTVYMLQYNQLFSQYNYMETLNYTLVNVIHLKSLWLLKITLLSKSSDWQRQPTVIVEIINMQQSV